MNYNNICGTGGASIKPSARRGIHDQSSSYGSREVMTRYGDIETEQPNPKLLPPNNEGVDEVDNVQSKHLRMSSPIASHHIRSGSRRKSLDSPSLSDNDYSSDDHHAKSLPATFAQYSHCSDIPTPTKLYNWSPPSAISTFKYSPERASPGSSNTSNSLNSSARDQEQRSFSQHITTVPGARHNQQKEEKTSILVWLVSVLVLFIAFAVIGFEWPKDIHIIYDEPKFYAELNMLGHHFSISDDSILQVQTGISTIFRKEDVGSFIFVYNSNEIHFDQVVFNNFMDAVASAAARYLRNESTSVQHIVVDTSTLDMQTDEELINEYREDVTKTGVMLVKEVDRVPSFLAMAFHYYCDEYNPLAKRSAIFFTLDMAKCSNIPDKQATHAYIEKCLAAKWYGVPDSKIGPLLTRVVDTVVDVTSI